MKDTIGKDTSGRSGYYGIFSEHLSSGARNDIAAQFSYWLSDFDLDLDNKIELNGGSIGITDSNLLTASTGTDPAGEASILSKDRIRYRAGSTCVVKFTAQFDNPHQDNSEAWIWPFNGQNWYRIWYENGTFKFQTLKKGEIVKDVSADEFNGGKYYYKDQYNYKFNELAEDALNIYRISYWYLGSAPTTLEVLGKDDLTWYTLHIFSYNDTPGTNIDIPYLPIQLKAKNNGNNENVSVSAASMNASILTEDIAVSTRYFHHNMFTSITDGTEIVLFNFRNKDIFNGKNNHIEAELISTDSVVSTDDVIEIAVYKNSSITGATYTDIDSTNSVIQYDTVGDFAGWKKIYSKYLTGQSGTGSNFGASSVSSVLADIGLSLSPNETATVTVKNLSGTAGYDIWLSLNWKELF